jgi:hypothetical protein
MKDAIEIYVRKSGDDVLLMFQGLTKGSFEDSATDMHVEMHVLPQWRSDDSRDHLRFKVNRITL